MREASILVSNHQREGYHHGRLREAVLVAAWDLVSEQGVGQLSLRECARRAGVSHAAPAYHFGTRQGLIDEIAAMAYVKLIAAIDECSAKERDGIMGCGLGYVAFATAWPRQFELILGIDRSGVTAEVLAGVRKEAIGRLSGAIRDAWTEANGKRPSTAVLARRTALGWSAAHGFASLLVNALGTPVPLPPAREVFAPLRSALISADKPRR